MEEDTAVRHQKLIDFRQLTNLINMTDEALQTPLHFRFRRFTDKKGFLIGGIILSLWLFSVIYFSVIKSDIRRIYFPVDNCGNFCGLDNDEIPNIRCSGQDYSEQPYLLRGECVKDCPYNISSGTYTCFRTENSEKKREINEDDLEITADNIQKREATEVEDRIKVPCLNDESQVVDDETGEIVCKNNTRRLHRSKRSMTTKDMFKYSRTPWWKFLIITIVTIVICKIAHYHTAIATASCYIYVFQILVHCIMVYFVSSHFSWWTFEHAIFFITHLVLYSMCLMVVGYYGPLFNIFYQAAMTIRRQIRRLFIFTLMATTVHFLILSSSIVALMHLATSTQPKEDSEHYKYEELSSLKKFFMIALVFLTNWMLQILAGFHCMTIGGAVASLYFKKNTHSLFIYSLLTLKYHMGTIAYWALFQPWIDIFKFATNALATCPSEHVNKVLDSLTPTCEYFSKLALIETAMHGQPLLKSGRRALEMISTHEGVIMAKTIVNMSWLLPQFNFIVITALISRLTFLSNDHVWISFTICLVVNVSIITVFFETSKVIGNALLLCYFEDETINGNPRCQLDLDHIKKFLTSAVEFRNKKFNLQEECEKGRSRVRRRSTS